MPSVDKKWAERIRAGDRRALIAQFKHEARELRRLMLEQARDLHPAWRDFRNFLADVGPSPGPAYRVGRVADGPGPYRPDTVCWRLGGSAERSAAAPSAVASGDAGRGSDWTMISGMDNPASASSDGEASGGRFASSAGREEEEGPNVVRMTRVDELDEACARELADLRWFAPSELHQEAFKQAYLAWRYKILPKFHSAATPKFLYLYTLVPSMVRCKATLIEAELWKPLTKAAQEQRDDSPAWKRFNELLPKAAMIVGGFEIYRQYSLTDDIEELGERLQTAEQRFRTGGRFTRPPVARTA